MQIFNYGSINIDHVYRVPHLVQAGETLASTHYQQVLGGKGANQSIAMARAGLGVTHIGRYHPSDQELLAPLRTALSDTSLLQAHADQASGHAIIQVDDQGETTSCCMPVVTIAFSLKRWPHCCNTQTLATGCYCKMNAAVPPK